MTITLIQMPYVAVERPSVALGTLTACLDRAGIKARSVYANLTYAEMIGLSTYERVNQSDITLQIGEWTFAEAAFREDALPSAPYFESLAACVASWPNIIEELLMLRREAARMIDDVAASIVASSPRVVGCSSVFQQQCASLALLRRIRELDPGIVTMLGGANCEGSMGVVTHERYDWLDYVVSGEADQLLPQLCRKILDDDTEIPAEELPFGVLGPAHRRVALPQATQSAARAVVRDLDTLPIPQYDDYFDQLYGSTLSQSVIPAIPFESSRGCWWGQKEHCTFCGLNGTGMEFRSKSQARVVDEINVLSARHGLERFMSVDNILDNRYFKEALPTLAEQGGLSLFYETKANLSRPQVEALADAGVCWIQPGIEALHDDLLGLLKKGTTVCINIQLLKWARTYGVWVIWNHLYGAPGDRREWYEEIADWLPLVAHLQAPAGAGVSGIRYDRFSPYFDRASDFGLELVPYWAYSQVYPLDPPALARQAYFFTDAGADGWHPERLQSLMGEWGRSWFKQRAGSLPALSAHAPELSMADDGESICIRDTRPCAVESNIVLESVDAAVYRACDSARSSHAIVQTLRQSGVVEDEVTASTARLCDLKIMARFGDRFLSLATDEPARPYRGFENYPGGLALTTGVRLPGPTAVDPGDVPLRQLFSSPSVQTAAIVADADRSQMAPQER